MYTDYVNAVGSEVAFQAPQRRARLVFALLHPAGSTTFWLFWSIHPYECDLWGVRGDASNRVLMSQPSCLYVSARRSSSIWWSAMALRMHAWIGQRIWHHAFCIVYSEDLAETSCLFFFFASHASLLFPVNPLFRASEQGMLLVQVTAWSCPCVLHFLLHFPDIFAVLPVLGCCWPHTGG